MHWRFKRKDGYKHRHHLSLEIKNHYNGSTLYPSILLLRVEEKLKCRATGACNEIENINSCLSCATDTQRTTSATLAQITAALHCFLSPGLRTTQVIARLTVLGKLNVMTCLSWWVHVWQSCNLKDFQKQTRRLHVLTDVLLQPPLHTHSHKRMVLISSRNEGSGVRNAKIMGRYGTEWITEYQIYFLWWQGFFPSLSNFSVPPKCTSYPPQKGND